MGVPVTKFGSNFVMSRLFHSPDLHVGCMRLPPGGVIGMHQAAGPQLLAVVEGEGWCRRRDGERTSVRAGEAIFWSEGEWHETGTASGLVAIVIESPHLVEGGSLGPVVKPTRGSMAPDGP